MRKSRRFLDDIVRENKGTSTAFFRSTNLFKILYCSESEFGLIQKTGSFIYFRIFCSISQHTGSPSSSLKAIVMYLEDSMIHLSNTWGLFIPRTNPVYNWRSVFCLRSRNVGGLYMDFMDKNICQFRDNSFFSGVWRDNRIREVCQGDYSS